MEGKSRRWVVPPEGGIYEVSFGYHSKMEVYATSMSDIPEISKIHSLRSFILLIVSAGLRPVTVSFTRSARELRLSTGYTKSLRDFAYPADTLYELHLETFSKYITPHFGH